MAGRTGAWLLPSAAVGVQVVINAPMAMQWLISLGVLANVSEQQRRFEAIAQRDPHAIGLRRLPPGRLRDGRREVNERRALGDNSHSDDDDDDDDDV
eukprot:CAMPEP_0115856640 /NCGR_PEP_ID=MMETSP0287-20121206/15159_1 /TAXON_ID=412157 /ORGANISM="Chrysochromulina rotalis, Strain UIO044" /LENGTH=96 /DNA_ID=CAMNT_0003310825 /DNA_START=135 /DNA_END=425 /DNA_ORIENTATION=+